MRCNVGIDGDDDEEEDSKIRVINDPEIKALNMKIEKRKMELERGNRVTQQDGFADCDTVTTGW